MSAAFCFKGRKKEGVKVNINIQKATDAFRQSLLTTGRKREPEDPKKKKDRRFWIALGCSLSTKKKPKAAGPLVLSQPVATRTTATFTKSEHYVHKGCVALKKSNHQRIKIRREKEENKWRRKEEREEMRQFLDNTKSRETRRKKQIKNVISHNQRQHVKRNERVAEESL